MTINDPIADMLTRIRNAGMARKPDTTMPATKILVAIAHILQEEGYIRGFRVEERRPHSVLTLELKYGPDRSHAIRELRRVSKPGLRVYAGKDELPLVRNGLGTAIVSTPQGVLSGHEARRRGIGGEVLCTVW
ncbi:MAG TPA: 30S ribosomal protein S8 [Thermomicrobiaceae bacterium]|nr:30S ribosomal protein S8 [Thermomicrobiaceae bacterium]